MHHGSILNAHPANTRAEQGSPMPGAIASRHADGQGTPAATRPRGFHGTRALAALAVVLALAPLATPAAAAEPVAREARAGLDLASAAAATWSADAVLVYLENDEALDGRGAASRWGYLFFSPGSKKSRGYSVRDGRILAAEDLEMKLEPPALAGAWIDSGAALERAEREAGRAYCREHEGRLATMLLMRGAFDEQQPDRTTWTLIYTSPRAPSLFVVVDAVDGKVRKTWRG
jgi:hypothetical protein